MAGDLGRFSLTSGVAGRKLGLRGGIAGVEGLSQAALEGLVRRLGLQKLAHPLTPVLIGRAHARLAQGMTLTQGIGQVGQGLALRGRAVLSQGRPGCRQNQGCGRQPFHARLHP